MYAAMRACTVITQCPDDISGRCLWQSANDYCATNNSSTPTSVLRTFKGLEFEVFETFKDFNDAEDTGTHTSEHLTKNDKLYRSFREMEQLLVKR